MDSLNRHMLTTYRDTWVKTPNIERLASQSVVFDNHWLGSAPCMPARRDIFTGRLNFLERNWGGIEPFDITLPGLLRKNNIFTHMITDHYHYFEIGGENYCQSFNTWELLRGQEFDPWVSLVNPPQAPKDHFGKVSTQYEANRSAFQTDADFPTPKTFDAACRWIDANKDADNFFLTVEVFDPHEPFDTPDEYLHLYDDTYDGPFYNWSTYAPVTEPDEATEHLRKKYAATLTMADKWLGKFLDTLEEKGLFEDTLIILTTDHGHMLGEHGYTGKNFMHVYNELAHLPLIVHLPDHHHAGKRINSITQNIDLMPTLLEFFGGLEIPDRVQGSSLRPTWEGNNTRFRSEALYGWFGRAVNITDGNYTYFRAPAREDNYPCYAYCCLPTTLWSYMGLDCMNEIETGRFLPYTDFPVYKIPMHGKDYMGSRRFINESQLFDIKNDFYQTKPLDDPALERRIEEMLVTAMKRAGAPSEQFTRLGLE